MKSKKIIALGLVAAMTNAMVTGCGGKNSGSRRSQSKRKIKKL